MQSWLVRGCVMAVVQAGAQVALAAIQVDHPNSTSVLSPVALALLVGVAGLWGGVDGWLRRPHRGMNWFYASLFGGLLSGLLGVVGKALFVDQTGIWALGSALTGGAAFTALLIMVPAGLGIAVGGRLDPPAGTSAEPPTPIEAEHRPTRRPAARRPASRGQGRRVVRSDPRG